MNTSDDALACYQSANELAERGEFADALTHYERAISLDPDNLECEVYVLAAWLLATCPDASLRNGPRAVVLATKACEDSDYEPWPLTALAAAYAQCGDFTNAINAQKRAIELYREFTHLEPAYRQTCRDRLHCYESTRALDYDPEP